MPHFRFRIPGYGPGIVQAPTIPAARAKVVAGANQRAWFHDQLLEAEDIEIEGTLFEHVTFFAEDETLGY